MEYEATSKPKKNTLKRVEKNGINLNLPKVKSSKELLRKVQIKHEKITSIDMRNKPPMVASKGQFNLSMFKV